MKFLDVKTDFAFKKVFGSEQSAGILLNFLNAILYSDSTQQITSLNIVDPYNVPKLQGMKETCVDVKAKLNDGTQVIIEMQVLNHQGLEQRILLNAAHNYSTQLQSGDSYTLINPVVALTIVDFNMFKPVSLEVKPVPYLSRFRLLETQTLAKYNGDIELVFVELPKFKANEQALKTLQDQWVYFIQNADKLDTIPSEMSASNAFTQAFEIINEAGMSADELDMQRKRKDFITVQKDSLAQAVAKGEAKGKAEGIAEATLAMARSMKLENLPISMIAKLTNLSPADIAAL
jgi:predicted transposase/invertase (TIGR01784 family)